MPVEGEDNFDDGGFSWSRRRTRVDEVTGETIDIMFDNNRAIADNVSWNNTSNSTPSFEGLAHANNIFSRNEIYNKSTNPLFNKTWRFGLLNPYGSISTSREFLFFTKPDLHIVQRDDFDGHLINQLAVGLSSGFWQDVFNNKKRLIEVLQASYGDHKDDPFNHLLQNMVNSNLETPSLQAPTVETASNMYGVNFSYRGSSEESDDGPEFSLEFKDDRWLNVYNYFRIYEEYETAKHHGAVRPYKKYIQDKIIHDQIAIYKFIVAEDMETIIYYGKYYGAMPTSLPRDVFNADNFDNGLSFPISWKAAFYEDMRPEILEDFNILGQKWWDYNDPAKNKKAYNLDVFNNILDRTDNRTATAAHIYIDYSSPMAQMSPDGYVYRLKWRGCDQY